MLIETLWWWCRYDSVTIDGKLTWQNQLNENNKPFFDLCDGILVNYSWEVFTSATYNLEILPFFPLNDFGKTFFFCMAQENFPKESAIVAGERKFDVYMGVDVFGRNSYGGGQWKVQSNTSLLQIILSCSFSRYVLSVRNAILSACACIWI